MGRFDCDSRGQLLLVGAVALAMVIVGLSIVMNTVLYTENVGTGESSVESASIEEFDYESQRSARSLLLKENHAERNRTMDQLQANISSKMQAYDEALSRSYAASGTVFAGVEYTEAVRNTTRIVQGVDRNFTYPKSTGPVDEVQDWEPVPDSTEIGWLLLNVDLGSTSGNQTTIVVENASRTLTYKLNRSEDGQGANLSMVVDDSASFGSNEITCESTSGRVLVDLRTGTVFDSDCSFTGSDVLDGPVTISIEDGQRLVGQYDIVANEEWDGSDPPMEAYADGDEDYEYCKASGTQPPCIAPVVWEATIDVTFHSRTARFDAERRVSIYDDG